MFFASHQAYWLGVHIASQYGLSVAHQQRDQDESSIQQDIKGNGTQLTRP